MRCKSDQELKSEFGQDASALIADRILISDFLHEKGHLNLLPPCIECFGGRARRGAAARAARARALIDAPYDAAAANASDAGLHEPCSAHHDIQ